MAVGSSCDLTGEECDTKAPGSGANVNSVGLWFLPVKFKCECFLLVVVGSAVVENYIPKKKDIFSFLLETVAQKVFIYTLHFLICK